MASQSNTLVARAPKHQTVRVAEHVSKTPIGVVGKITHANRAAEIGFYVEVQNDRDGATGGFYVLMWRGSEGYDSWVENLSDVDA